LNQAERWALYPTRPGVKTHQKHRHQLVHRDAAIGATENMAPDAHFKTLRTTGHSHNRQQHAIGQEGMGLCNVFAKPKERDQSTATIAIKKRTAGIDPGQRIDT
jgi:hypothetical protein